MLDNRSPENGSFLNPRACSRSCSCKLSPFVASCFFLEHIRITAEENCHNRQEGNEYDYENRQQVHYINSQIGITVGQSTTFTQNVRCRTLPICVASFIISEGYQAHDTDKRVVDDDSRDLELSLCCFLYLCASQEFLQHELLERGGSCMSGGRERREGRVEGGEGGGREGEWGGGRDGGSRRKGEGGGGMENSWIR